MTFEHMMSTYEVDRARWVFKLAPQLTGKAQQTYAAMSAENSTDYEAVKAVILRRYNINEETYRQRFRAATLNSRETAVELATRIGDLAGKWTRDCMNAGEVVDLLV